MPLSVVIAGIVRLCGRYVSICWSPCTNILEHSVHHQTHCVPRYWSIDGVRTTSNRVYIRCRARAKRDLFGSQRCTAPGILAKNGIITTEVDIAAVKYPGVNIGILL